MGRSSMQGSSWHYEYHSEKKESSFDGSEWDCKWFFDDQCEFKASACTGGKYCKWYERKKNSDPRKQTTTEKTHFQTNRKTKKTTLAAKSIYTKPEQKLESPQIDEDIEYLRNAIANMHSSKKGKRRKTKSGKKKKKNTSK